MNDTPIDNLSGAERRRYFRIRDQVGIHYRVLEAAELARGERELRRKGGLLSGLEQHEDRLAGLLQRLDSRDPLVAEVLRALDHKLDYAIQQLQLESRMTQQLAFRVHEVSISACGMAMVLDQPLAQQSVLELQLNLLPTDRSIQCHGLVVESEMLPGDQGFNTRIDFCDMSARDQETLIQHIVQRQSQLLGDLRAQLEQ